MAEKKDYKVQAKVREGRGKNDSRRLRVENKIPVSIYGGGEEAVAVVVDLKDLAAILRTDTGVNTVFSLDIAGVGAHDVIFQDRQIDGVKGRLLHADLMRLRAGAEVVGDGACARERLFREHVRAGLAWGRALTGGIRSSHEGSSG